MSGRPRLVEEGKPITMDMGIAPKSASRSQEIVLTDRRVDSIRKTSDNNNHRPSSLAARAMASSTFTSEKHNNKKKKYALSTRLVIGGGIEESSEEISEEEHLVEEMLIDQPIRHTAPAHHTNTHKTRPVEAHRLVVGGNVSHATTAPHHYVIGQQHQPQLSEVEDFRHVEKMEGVEDHGTKGPLVVMDGANIAYAYADAMSVGSSLTKKTHSREPDAYGIQVAAKYFLAVEGVRVLVVIPAPWLRVKPRPGDSSQDNALMLTPQLEVLHDLKERGLLVSAPPRDDDDAYCILIARREVSRAQSRGHGGGGYVLSNDMFRDAIQRDGELHGWLNRKDPELGSGRISFTFCDMGSMDDHGDRELDFVPNPRHPLVQWVESQHRSNNLA